MATQSYYPNQQHAARVAADDPNTNMDAPISLATQYITGVQENTTLTHPKPKRGYRNKANNNHSNNNDNNNENDDNKASPNGQQMITLIHQATNNIERMQNSANIKEVLSEAIRIQGKKEKILRQSTVSISNKDINTNDISAIIDEEWVFKLEQAPVTYWNDKEYLNCQFINHEAKANFLNSGINLRAPLFGRVTTANGAGEHFKRRPIRIVINNVRKAINTNRLIEIVKNCTDFDTEVSEVKDGSPHPISKARSVFFKINGHGLRILIDKLDGEIPYADRANPTTKARLRAKINCKPWQCRDCMAIGIHQCEGKKCRNCANKGHVTKDCRSVVKFCGNCKKKGHRSTDLHCPTYLNEVAKEIRKMDIPITMFEDKQLRMSLAKSIQLK